MGALKKADIADHITTTIGTNKAESKEIVDLFIAEICFSLEQGEEVMLTGFGKFCLHDKKERPGRNPRTNEFVPISARRVAKFKPSPSLVRMVQRYLERPMSQSHKVKIPQR